MRIAFVLDEVWDSALTHYAYGIYRALKSEHDVKLFCLKDSYIDKKSDDDKIYIEKLRNKNPLKGIKGLKSLSKAFRMFSPDVVVTILGDATFFSCLLKKRFGFKLIRIFGENKELRAPRECIDKLILPADFLKSRVDRRRVSDIFVIKGFVDTDRFVFNKEGRDKIRKLYGISDNEILFGAVGRLDTIKGYFVLIKAFAQLDKNAKLMIVGQEKGIKKEDLQELIDNENLNKRVIIVDSFRDDIVEIMSAFDVGVISSIGSETIARVMFEFMSVGLPIVTTDVGMLKEISDESFSVLTKAKSESSMVEAMKEILKKDRNTMRLNAVSKAEQYSFLNFQKQLLDIFSVLYE